MLVIEIFEKSILLYHLKQFCNRMSEYVQAD